MKYRIAGIGEILWDMLPGGAEIGGAPANFAYHVQALGGEGIVVSSIGDDELGKAILERFNALSLSTRYISMDNKHPTGTVSVNVDTAGKPFYTIHENVAWDYIPRTPSLTELAGTLDAVCFGSLGQRSEVSRDTIQWFMHNVSPETLRIFDVTIRQSFYSWETIEASLKLAHVLKLSEEELQKLAEFMALDGHELAIVEEIAARYDLRLVAFTRGENGSLLYAKGAISEHPGYKTEVMDTVGAGDSFTAVLVLGMLMGKELDAINDAANRVASFVCSRRGATPELPDELRNIYASNT
jgi:fructokinase